jgi:hypothetical protein
MIPAPRFPDLRPCFPGVSDNSLAIHSSLRLGTEKYLAVFLFDGNDPLFIL